MTDNQPKETLLPVEPTKAMFIAFTDTLNASDGSFEMAYAAMLRAGGKYPAPQPQDADRVPLKINQSKEWWLEKALSEPDDCDIAAYSREFPLPSATLSTDQYAQGFTAGQKSRDQEVKELVDILQEIRDAEMVEFNRGEGNEKPRWKIEVFTSTLLRVKRIVAKYTNNQGE